MLWMPALQSHARTDLTGWRGPDYRSTCARITDAADPPSAGRSRVTTRFAVGAKVGLKPYSKKREQTLQYCRKTNQDDQDFEQVS
jgi:predicted secreted protein